ncbi:MAG: Gfo/Idh/MocA family oxidoreductase [Atopostipes sp.]|nr:Gfo/Idh/MocA family oxidoreductase [Atopostipes sp.]
MKKLQLGTVGTSWITDSFIDAALKSEYYELNTVYSRNQKNGEEFAGKYGKIKVSTDFDSFVDKELDVIYIASPNSLHYEQSLLALKAGKHVMVEKPATINEEEWDDLLETAEVNNVFILEAAKHMHLPNLKNIQKEIKKLGNIRGATLPYIRYSSRYDNVLAGEEPNVFSLDFAGGALMDLGIYPVYTAVALFGEPEESHYFARKIRTGVDGIGTIILRYENFDVTILVGKNATSAAEVEIYGEDETLIVNHVSALEEARLMDVRTFEERKLSLEESKENDMIYEAETLAKMIQNKGSKATKKRYQELSSLARIVTRLLKELRKDAEIIYPDK